MAATKNLDLKNDYFAAEAISRLFGGVVGAGAGLMKMFSRGKVVSRGAKGALSQGTIKSVKDKRNTFTPRYNSPTSWSNFDKLRTGSNAGGRVPWE